MNRFLTVMLLIIFSLAGCTSILTESKKNVNFSIPFTGEAPLPNGSPEDNSWQNARSLSLFMTGGSVLAQQQTTVSLMTDKKNLYVLFKADYTNHEKLKASCHQNNSEQIYKDEAVELILATDLKRKSFFRIAVNTEGFYFAEKCDDNSSYKEKIKMDNAEIRVYSDRKSWYAELKIPVSHFNAEIDNDTVWAMNFIRYSKSSTPSSWTGTSSMKQPSSLQPVSFGEKTPVYYVIDHADLFSADIRILNNSQQDLNLKAVFRSDYMEIAENAFIPANASIMLKLRNKNPSTEIDFNPSATKNVLISIRDAETEKILSSSFFKCRPEKPFDTALESFYIRHPNQLDIFFTGNKQNIEYADIEITKNLNETPLKKLRIDKSNMDQTIRINTDDFAPGRYILSTFYYDYQNDMTIISRKTFLVISAENDKIRQSPKPPFILNKRGVITDSDSKPFLVFAAFPSAQMENTPFMKAEVNSLSPATYAKNQEPYILQLNSPSLSFNKKNATIAYLFDDTQSLLINTEKNLETKIPGSRVFTRILADSRYKWYTRGKKADSLEEVGIPEYLNKINSKIKEIAQGEITSAYVNDSSSVKYYSDSVDIIELSYAPYSLNRKMESGIDKDLAKIKETLKNKPFILRLHNYARVKPEALRATSYMVLLHGSKGIAYDINNSNKLSVYEGLRDELELLYPVIVSEENFPENLFSSSTADVFFSLKKLNTDFYIFAINKSNSSQRCNFSVSEKYLIDSISILFENRTLNHNKNMFHDLFLPHEVHVYKISISENK